MARFGGNEFKDLSVPVIFAGLYFILEPGDPPQITVMLKNEGEPVFVNSRAIMHRSFAAMMYNDFAAKMYR
jgi:hypothetical protein